MKDCFEVEIKVGDLIIAKVPLPFSDVIRFGKITHLSKDYSCAEELNLKLKETQKMFYFQNNECCKISSVDSNEAILFLLKNS